MATSEQFSLRWNNFHSNLTTGFHDLLEASDLVDVTFAIDGRFLLAHKIVLSICSPYFKQMFKMNPCNHPIVILKDVTHDNMKDILEFMYVGEVNVLRENLPSFLRTAELLQVKGLTGEDTQSETSSKKDEKQDSICGEQEEDQDLSQMFEAENMRLPQFSPDLSIPLKKTQANKRNSKQILNSSKRTKIDNNNVNKPNKCIMEEDVIPDQPNIKLESVYDFDEQKETIKSFDGNSVNCSSDTNMQDHGINKWEEKTTKHVFKCEKCLKIFSRRDHLRTHEKNIHGEDVGPFACIICSQLYKNAESLRKHIAKFHFHKGTSEPQHNKIQVSG